MANALSALVSLAAAGTLLLSAPLKPMAPQNDIDGNLFLVNRQWKISESYFPVLVEAQVSGQLRRMRPEAAAALEEMYAACKDEIGVKLTSISGFRAYSKQAAIYHRKLRSTGSEEKANEYVALPGASEHQLGLAMDVGQKNSKKGLSVPFGSTKGGKWLRENCHRFGFVIRYRLGDEKITGYEYEPWHVRYVGKELAEKLTEADLPLETYLLTLREEALLELLQGK